MHYKASSLFHLHYVSLALGPKFKYLLVPVITVVLVGREILEDTIGGANVKFFAVKKMV